MTLPALWIAAAFAAGLGLASRGQSSPTIWFASAAIAILAGLILIWRQRAASAWNRRVAAVSAGEGYQFGYPVEGVMERYARAGVQFLRSDRDGEVTALTDGHTLEKCLHSQNRIRSKTADYRGILQHDPLYDSSAASPSAAED
ncbi:MAG TPA: hypothetical protein VN875_11670 [Candidatus Binatus sp.]|jgi:hypothetical protein|nr:hypothetical protein [Candidatus Binatus sp.]